MTKSWFTLDPAIAAKLSAPDAAQQIQADVARREAAKAEAIEASRASCADVDLPRPEGLEYLPYQRAGISRALHLPAVLFGDEMGLGKTIQVIGMINTDPSIKRVLIVCPASLKLNWQNELRKWLVRQFKIVIATGQSCPVEYADILIVNYDILDRHAARLRAGNWDLVVADECHYLKNPKAKRTIAMLGKDARKGHEDEAVPAIRGRRAAFLTGTPIPNRPVEGWPMFHYLDSYFQAGEFRKFWPYATRYCGAYQNRYGWDLTGSGNLAELQERLRATFMIRRLKMDVLTELPPKRRAVIEFEDETGAAAVEASAWERHERGLDRLRASAELAKASSDPADYKAAVERLAEAARAAFTEISKLRHDTAVAKIPFVVEHLQNCIEGGQKVVVFAHHHDVIEALAKEFGDAAITIYGPLPLAQREANKERFQTDPTCMLAIGGFGPMGTGWTLTAASHVVFAELDWVPGNVTQAEDRCHRIGQRESVLVEHLVLEGSLDARMAHILVEKQDVISAALDKLAEQEPVIPTERRERAATDKLTQAKVAEEAAQFTDEQIRAIGDGLMCLANMDEDHAQELNGCGFSKVDCWIGHSLAEAAAYRGLSARQAVLGAKLVNKYRRQIPTLAARARGMV